MKPTDTIDCIVLRAKMPARVCALRQHKRLPNGAPDHLPCGVALAEAAGFEQHPRSGRNHPCEQGRWVLAQLGPNFKLDRQPRVIRADLAQQRAAQRHHQLSTYFPRADS